MEDMVATPGYVIDDGDGSIPGREDCGVCIGDCGGRNVDPGEDAAWRGEPVFCG